MMCEAFCTKVLQMNRVSMNEYPCMGKAAAHKHKQNAIHIYIGINGYTGEAPQVAACWAHGQIHTQSIPNPHPVIQF